MNNMNPEKKKTYRAVLVILCVVLVYYSAVSAGIFYLIKRVEFNINFSSFNISEKLFWEHKEDFDYMVEYARSLFADEKEKSPKLSAVFIRYYYSDELDINCLYEDESDITDKTITVPPAARDRYINIAKVFSSYNADRGSFEMIMVKEDSVSFCRNIYKLVYLVDDSQKTQPYRENWYYECITENWFHVFPKDY